MSQVMVWSMNITPYNNWERMIHFGHGLQTSSCHPFHFRVLPQSLGTLAKLQSG